MLDLDLSPLVLSHISQKLISGLPRGHSEFEVVFVDVLDILVLDFHTRRKLTEFV